MEITNTNGCWYHPRYSGQYHVTSGHHHFISGHYHVTSGHHHFISGHPQLAPTVVANYFSSKTFLRQRSQQTFQQTQLVEHFISCCKLSLGSSTVIRSDQLTTDPTCVQGNLLYFWFTLIVEWKINQSTNARLLCHFKATLPFQGYFAISRQLCHLKATLPFQDNFVTNANSKTPGSDLITTDPTRVQGKLLYFWFTLIVEWKTNQSNNARRLCHQCKAILPPMQAQRLQGHPWSSLIISFDSLLLELKTNECNCQSKNQTKTFSVKENYHKIRRSACFSPTFLFV